MVYCTRYQITRPYMDIDEETADEYYEEARSIRRSLKAARERAEEEGDEARSYYLNQIHV